MINTSINETALLIYCEFKSQLLQKTNLSTSYIQGQLEEAKRQLVLAINQSEQEDSTMHEKPYHQLNHVIAAFSDAIAAQDITPPIHINADGELHRFHVDGDKPGSRNGWYRLNLNPIPYGVFGYWKTGAKGKWFAKSLTTWQERRQTREYIKQKQQQQAETLSKSQEATANLCLQRWQRYRKADISHPYLIKKQIKPYIARQIDDILALPIVDADGKLWSIQYIKPEGSKVLCLHGAKKSHFIPVHHDLRPGIKILICEGFATGASLAELESEACVIAAIDAGNLEPVAIAIRKKYPSNDIVICADDDRTLPNNVGLIKAKQAAQAVNARWVKPQWSSETPIELSDFNDWMCWLNTQEETLCFTQL